MKLSELAFACYIYSRMSDDYDGSYHRFLAETSPLLDLQQERHRMVLLKWLNDWGCRQFAKECHSLAAQEICEWHQEIVSRLFSIDTGLLALTSEDFDTIELAYSKLVVRTASLRKLKNGKESCVEIGPTGTSKILFALRPNALIPWDGAIRAEFGHDGSASSYCSYLEESKEQLEALSVDCVKYGFNIAGLPQILGRPSSSVAKLIDEFHWVTISRKCPVPTQSERTRWVNWQ